MSNTLNSPLVVSNQPDRFFFRSLSGSCLHPNTIEIQIILFVVYIQHYNIIIWKSVLITFYVITNTN